MTSEQVVIGLGSNLSRPQQQVTEAIHALSNFPDTHVLRCSSFYQTKPIGPQQPDFINVVVTLKTSLSPQLLLDYCQALENQMGRERQEKWGPRIIDCDILLYGKKQINLPHLVIPHPEMYYRPFVLVPLFELYPDFIFPDGTNLSILMKHCDIKQCTRISSTLSMREECDASY